MNTETELSGYSLEERAHIVRLGIFLHEQGRDFWSKHNQTSSVPSLDDEFTSSQLKLEVEHLKDRLHAVREEAFKKGERRAIYRQDLAGNAGNRARPPPRAAKLRPRAQLGHVHAQSMGHVHAQLSGVGARVAPRRHSVCNLTSLLLPSGAHALGEGLAEEAHTAYMSKRAAR